MDPEATYIINVVNSDCLPIAVRSNWFNSSVCSNVLAVLVCFCANIQKNFADIICIAPDVCLATVKSDEYFEQSDMPSFFSADEPLPIHA